MSLLGIGQRRVYLVGEHQKVVLFHHPGYLQQLLPLHHSPGGVVGVGHNEELCPLGYMGLQLLCRQLKAVLRPGLYGHRHPPGHLRDGHIAHKAGLGDEHLVPGTDKASDAEIYGL